jgi:ferredoxin--NADP+ reductase
MSEAVGTQARPVRVAVVGAGPAGFFVSEALLKRGSPVFSVDLFERLPTPFGLVRAGVAPDHQKIKSVTRTFEKTAQHGRFRYFGHVSVGKDVTHAELLAHYDQVVYAIGSSGDRRLGIPGEELTGCHAGTAFVGWYNGHPDFRDFPFDLTTKRAVVVGAGNVALDIARVLLRNRDELAKTDMPGYALEALEKGPLEEVVLLARRGVRVHGGSTRFAKCDLY